MNNILLIEPDTVLAKIYKTFLRRQGFIVSVAKNAQAAITKADKKTPSLVIVELQLIEHSGIEFLYEFRSYSEWQKVPVIINSQVSPREFSKSWQILKKDLGVNEYLYKPNTKLKNLLLAVNQHILQKV